MEPTWQTADGRLRLYLGDCLDVLPTLESTQVDAVVTDPPYGIVNEFGSQKRLDGTRTLSFAWDRPGITEEVVLPAIEIAVSMASSVFAFCGGDQFGDVLKSVRAGGMTAKPASWVKKCPPPACPGNWWPSAFELAVYGYRCGAYFGDADPKRSNVFVADGYRHGQPGKVDHPTQKPLKLVQRIVEAVVPPDGAALDPFMGSGTAGVACVRAGRRFVGVEQEPRYFDLARRRIEAELLRAPLFDEAPTIVQRRLAL